MDALLVFAHRLVLLPCSLLSFLLPPRRSAMIRTGKCDMLSEKLNPVDRNAIWREYLGKERERSVLRTEFAIHPASLATVTDKPHAPYSQRLSPAQYAALAAKSVSNYELRKSMQHTPRAAAAAASSASGSTTARLAGGQIMTSRKSGAPAKLNSDATETVELLHHLQGALLTPQQKFSHPQTANQEYGWISAPFSQVDHSERDLFRSGFGLEGVMSQRPNIALQSTLQQNTARSTVPRRSLGAHSSV